MTKKELNRDVRRLKIKYSKRGNILATTNIGFTEFMDSCKDEFRRLIRADSGCEYFNFQSVKFLIYFMHRHSPVPFVEFLDILQ